MFNNREVNDNDNKNDKNPNENKGNKKYFILPYIQNTSKNKRELRQRSTCLNTQ